MNAFSHMTRQLDRSKVESHQPNSITKSEYEIFCKEFVFEKLKGVQFGESFCKKFHITDYVLSILTNEASAMKYIKTVGYIKK